MKKIQTQAVPHIDDAHLAGAIALPGERDQGALWPGHAAKAPHTEKPPV